MRQGVVGHEALADLGCAARLFDIAARVCALDQFDHELGQHHHTFRGLHETTYHLDRCDVGYVLVFGDQNDLVIGYVAIVKAVTNR